MTKSQPRWVCGSCGRVESKWVGRCPECAEWDSLVAESAPRGKETSRAPAAVPVALTDAAAIDSPRIPVGIREVDRVLGGGLVPGSVVLLGGDPGVGKSTLLLQVLAQIGARGARCLYVSGEESVAQTGLRARRIGAAVESVAVVSETSAEAIATLLEGARAVAAVVDSVQTLGTERTPSAPGSVSQLREATAMLVGAAKRTGTALVLVGHVTKDGAIAGPKVLEHMVDAVLYFEGERAGAYRTLRAVKNRFGSALEVGVFEMRGPGLVEVPNPSALLLAERPASAPGSAVVATAEGSRSLLCEVQALVADSTGGQPRRTVTGVDRERAGMLMAVLERVTHHPILERDLFLNVTGGLRLEETAVDLGVCLAVMSSARGVPLPEGVACFGEVGLSGEIRSVARAEARVAEAAQMGYRTVVLPARNAPSTVPPGVRLVPVKDIRAAGAILRSSERNSGSRPIPSERRGPVEESPDSTGRGAG